MGECLASYQAYDEEGRAVGGGDIFLPSEVDWMPIEVKAHWFRYMGEGPEAAKYVLLKSQGEQRLLKDVSLRRLDYRTHKEKERGSINEIERFVDEGGFSRKRRNQ